MFTGGRAAPLSQPRFASVPEPSPAEGVAMHVVLALALVLQDKEEELTPEKAIQLLKETRTLMEEAESLLNDSARGKALLAEKDDVA